MRVVQIIDELRPSGGAERLQVSFAEAVRDSDVELTIVTLHKNDVASARELEALGARVVPFAASRFRSLRRAVLLVRFLRSGDFDVVHTHLVRSTILGCLAAWMAGIPSVATLHNTRRRVGMWGVLLLLEAWVLRHVTDKIVGVGWETARVHQRRVGERQIEVVPNAVGEPAQVDPSERDAVREELGIPREAPLVLAVGRLNKQKGFADLLRMFERVVATHANAYLVIAGNGSLHRELARRIAKSGLASRVQLLGLRRDIPRLLAAADVYVSAALWEGLPVAILEAMAAGLPVVATRVGDVARVVGPGMGTLVEPGDPEALFEALQPLLDDRALCRAQGEVGRAHVRQEFGQDAWAARLLGLYRDLGAPDACPDPAPSTEEHRCAS